LYDSSLKTTAVQTCCYEIIKERESEKGSNRESVPIVCYINVTHIFKAKDVTSQSRNEILGRIGTALGMKTDSITTTQIARKMLKIDGSAKVKPVLILLLDEIDVIVAETNRDTQELLEELLVWASNPSYSFALIGISNEIQLRRFKALERVSLQI
jgi:Cdc6-like AAA superfamily ATPase